MKRIISTIFLTGCLFGTANPFHCLAPEPATAQFSVPGELYYTFYGQEIPLTLRSDTIAVSFKNQGGTRGFSQPAYLRLQQALQGGGGNTRGGSPPPAPLDVEVTPLGDRYALVKLLSNTLNDPHSVTQRIQEQPFVESTLPVLTRISQSEQLGTTEQTVILPNEIVLSLEPGMTNLQRNLLLDRHNLEIVRPLRFSQNRYIVKSKSVSGTAVLNVANQLNGASGVQSATPNFIQSVTSGIKEQTHHHTALAQTPQAEAKLRSQLSRFPKRDEGLYTTNMLPLQWHLDSTSRRGQLLPRTDVRATEAWQKSNGGDGVVVAVIDSLIQWDHPDLVNNVYTVGDVPDKLPGEVNGWDFSGEGEGDPDTRINSDEIAALQPQFQKSFELSNGDLLKEYEFLAFEFSAQNPDASEGEIATLIRNYLRNQIAAEFHGTWCAGVIAARPADERGLIGVAPNAKILPIRVFGLGGEITTASLIEAVGYAASRGADAINMSLGSLMPDRELTDQIFEILDTHPNLVIIASAGNEGLDGVGFPAAIPGVLSVGATNISGNRTVYSNYGGRLDLVAPGGDTELNMSGGILTTGGTWVDGFWQGIPVPDYAWGVSLDPKGKYVQVEGTSFAAPTVSGVMALMKGEDPHRRLNRDRLVSILKETASYDGLAIAKADENQYRLQASIGFGSGMGFPLIRPSGIFPQPNPVSAWEYFFGSGLVNAEAAVKKVKGE
ncbi:MAG TPA: peptidase S8 [Cyanobacteria bacterium UBA11149]|nr:peptidase S8 [Cyanobacteria bacterium UBA11367]HBE58753.1 peptidase S8 [Cyanobacteria bacterium UBA11366]HBR75095.1 peptidase S8 [Cyanobacteria bacterium UBA11159]HBS71285.1 peptidase S8 [Cyanobacteria bacterium UBA11153]HBW87709.1 peptidase S8 [Cyanobacteria bacterium UBA11149]HCA96959.1 peptidase S8 [Cyanobacteria bacterium UBA9226]